MSANKILILSGVLIIIIPHLGLPPYFERITLSGVGCVLILIAVLSHIRRRSVVHDNKEHQDTNKT